MERIVITASAGSFPGLADALRAPGRTVADHPLIHFRAPPDWKLFDDALARLPDFQAVALTSPRAATALTVRLANGATRWPRDTAMWAGGSATAAALGDVIQPVRTPIEREIGSKGAAAALAESMLHAGVAGPVLFPCGNTRRELLPKLLRRAGLRVDEVVCYVSVLAGEHEAKAAVSDATLVIVASPSVAQLLSDACPPGSRPALIAVGPTTAASARDQGWEPAAVATHPGTVAVVAAVSEVLARRSVS